MKIIKEWSYPENITKEEIEKDVDRQKAIGLRYVINNELVKEKSWGEQTNNNWIESEANHEIV